MRFLSYGIVLAALASAAYAAPIVYVESGQLSGRLGTGIDAISLTNANFSFTFFGDTANVISGLPDFNQASSTAITIGASSGSFSETVAVGVVPGSGLIGFGDLASTKAINFTAAGAVGYLLATPISVSNPTATFAAGTYATSLGSLLVTGAQNLTFTATLATPEPGTAALSFSGLLALAGLAYCRRKQS